MNDVLRALETTTTSQVALLYATVSLADRIRSWGVSGVELHNYSS